LFSESNGRLIVSVAAEHAARFEAALTGHACRRLGRVLAERRLTIQHGGRAVADVPLSSLRAAFERSAS
jgi:phosphoribosylformylglycinamidine (FGAM) synthase-like enzyme